MWIHVIPHFERFLQQIELTPEQRADAATKADNIARCLWNRYYFGEFTPTCYLKVGSYGKGTAVRPPSDLDMLFVLPDQVCGRVAELSGNKQSQLLREVKDALLETFPRTDMSVDGQPIHVPFASYDVEVVPAFSLGDGRFLTADTADGGKWRTSHPVAEYRELQRVDALSAGKATHLCKMLKAWKRECSVEIKSVCLEVLARVFAEQWQYKKKEPVFLRLDDSRFFRLHVAVL